MNATDQLAHFSGGTDDLAMTGLWYSHKRVRELVEASLSRAEAAEAEAAQLRETLDGLRGRVEALAVGWERGIPEGPAAIHFCPEGCGDIWETEPSCCHEPGYRAAARDLRNTVLVDGGRK